ncbi:MAG TPA: diacylglycerol kinase family protein [Longimicrobium sp.]|jgi:YegS/Rv2252/BmrU family lipid kinase|nr:diacylglycerol kinase family protein [Longimicrobium sp.]
MDTDRVVAAGRERLLLFANRRAGTLARSGPGVTLEQYAREAGLDVQVVYTRSSSSLRRQLREQVVGKRERVLVAGGDGTIHAAVQELAGTGVELGILPQGTANNFATALRLPMDLPSAFRVLAEGQVEAVDLGDVGGEYFTEAAGVGVFADILAITGAKHDARTVLRGIAQGMRLLLTMKPQRLSLVLDGRRYTEETMSVTVANSYCVGLNLPIAPCARLTDGQFHVIVIGALTRREMFAYYQAIRTQTHLDLPKVHALQAREVQIAARRRLIAHVDDRVRRRTPLTARIRPGALKVVVDRL